MLSTSLPFFSRETGEKYCYARSAPAAEECETRPIKWPLPAKKTPLYRDLPSLIYIRSPIPVGIILGFLVYDLHVLMLDTISSSGFIFLLNNLYPHLPYVFISPLYYLILL